MIRNIPNNTEASSWTDTLLLLFTPREKEKKQILVISVFLISVIKTTIPKFQTKKDWVNQVEIKPILIKKISTKFFIPSDYAEKDFIIISLYFSPIKNANTKYLNTNILIEIYR